MRRFEYDRDWDFYVEALMDRVACLPKYHMLLRYLGEVNYFWVLPLDRARALDGVLLREEYGVSGVFGMDAEDCSVLEMMVALAVRLDNEYIGDMSEEHPEVIFWEMICNFGFDYFTNYRFNSEDVFEILHDWMSGKYRKNGKNTPFLLKHVKSENDKVTVWEQAMAYISENF